MIAMRVLISWISVNTANLLAAQLMHVSYTGALVVFASPRIDARQEVALCAGTLARRGRDRSRIWHGIETARGRYLAGDARKSLRHAARFLAPTRCGDGHELTPDKLALAERGSRWRCQWWSH